MTLLARHWIELGELRLPLLALALTLALTLGLRLALPLLAALALPLLAAAYGHARSLSRTLLPALTHRCELSQLGAVAVGVGSFRIVAHAVATVLLAPGSLPLLATVDHDAIAARAAVATHAGWHIARVVGVENDVDHAATQVGLFHDEGVAQLMHAILGLAHFALVLHGTKKIGQVFMAITHIPTLVGEALAGVVDSRKLLLELLGAQFPGGLDGRGGEHHGVGAQQGGKSEGETEADERERALSAVHGGLEV